jgi:ectoine hydroxylase-related dioxygenase (phytanoyl-CoA dioxygenase family)
MNSLGGIKEDGFAVLPSVFPRIFVDQILDGIAQLSPPRSRAGIRHALALGPVAEVARHPLLVALAREVLGVDAFPYRATLFEKSSDANWLVVWHQDTALPLRSRLDVNSWGPWSVKEGVTYAHAPASALSQVLALRVHLDDSTADNGPLRVLPRTHMSGVLSDDSIHELSTRIPPIDCTVSKGGVVAMRPLVVHASSKSHNELPRRVLHIEYAASESIAEPLQLALA